MAEMKSIVTVLYQSGYRRISVLLALLEFLHNHGFDPENPKN